MCVRCARVVESSDEVSESWLGEDGRRNVCAIAVSSARNGWERGG